MNNWKSIWNNREHAVGIDGKAKEEVFRYLKNLMAISSVSEEDVQNFQNQFAANLNRIKGTSGRKIRSYFDVGCGSGSYLYYLGSRDNELALGGLDYSAPLIEAARQVLQLPYIRAEVKELSCTEAIDINTEIKYDCVYSRSIFQYFQDEAYGMEVAAKMLEKATSSVAILDLHDAKKREAFLEYRRSVIQDYDQKYADTPHQFYSKESFLELADQYNCDILFARDPMKGYWNEPFVFDVYLYKRGQK